MRTAVAGAPMAFFPFCWMQLPREGCAKIRRREARCTNMCPPGFVAVNRNEYETTTFRNKNHRVSRCVASHKRYSCPRNRFLHLLRNPSWRNPRPPWSQRQGQVLVQGCSTAVWDPIRLRRGIGYVIQDAGLFPHFTVAENIGLVPSLEKWDRCRTAVRVGELLTLVGLDPSEFADRRPRELSGGQRQRVGVARALAADPPILLMDEPFGALDPVTRAELQREFSALARRLGKTIVFVTHDLHEALLLATRIVLLQTGRIVASATPQEFLRLDHPEVRAFTASLAVTPGARA